MKIAIIGASGFIGSNLKLFLSKFNYDITIISLRLAKYNFNANNFDVIINLAGKAHDTNNISNSSEYFNVNTKLCNRIFDSFLSSNAIKFITISSIKAVSDFSENNFITENTFEAPSSIYGRSKLAADKYILNHSLNSFKKFYILRPAMVYGLGNKGNLNLLYNFVTKSRFWPLSAFINKRSFCYVDNLCYTINELIIQHNIESGIYNIADDDTISTNQIISIISDITGKKIYFISIPKKIIKLLFYFGGILKSKYNSILLKKITENYLVSNRKITAAIGNNMPYKTNVELFKTFISFRG